MNTLIEHKLNAELYLKRARAYAVPHADFAREFRAMGETATAHAFDDFTRRLGAHLTAHLEVHGRASR